MISELEEALRADPNDLTTLINLGKLYLNERRIDDAIPLLESACRYPNVFLAHNYLADAYYLAVRPHEAIVHYEKALRLRPGDPDVTANLSVCYWQIGDYTQAYRTARRVRDRHPVNFGLMSLVKGDYNQGWKYWEFLETSRSFDSLPLWDGQRGKHVIVLDEDQGFGDTLMFARFLPMVADLCDKVTFQTRSPLLNLMRASFPNIQVIEQIDDVAQFDAQIRLFSLPRLFGITLQTIPSEPYLRAAKADCIRWKSALSNHDGIKVGLRWSGNPLHRMDRIRSIGDLGVLAPLRDIPGVTYVSLANEQLTMPPVPILDFSDQLVDFAQTAALISALDLVISIDTGVVNLAGALGAETWLMNTHGTDWRWGTQDDHSPWYPSIRIFRQPAGADWKSLVDSVATSLWRLVGP